MEGINYIVSCVIFFHPRVISVSSVKEFHSVTNSTQMSYSFTLRSSENLDLLQQRSRSLYHRSRNPTLWRDTRSFFNSSPGFRRRTCDCCASEFRAMLIHKFASFHVTWSRHRNAVSSWHTKQSWLRCDSQCERLTAPAGHTSPVSRFPFKPQHQYSLSTGHWYANDSFYLNDQWHGGRVVTFTKQTADR